MQAVTAFEEQYISVDADLRQFFRNSGLPFNNPTIIGPNDQTNPGGEVSDFASAAGSSEGLNAVA